MNENDLAAMMVGRDVNFKVEKKEMAPGEVVLDVKDIHAKDYRDVEILRGLNLQVRRGEIVGLAGVDGNGQTELVEILTGLRKAESGEATLLGKDVFNRSPKETFESGISSIPADRQKHGLILEFSNEDNLILQHFEEEPYSRKGILNRKAIREHAVKLTEKFDVRPRGSEGAPAGTLSGGNQQKVIIAREVTNDKELLIAVNPTRGLDVGAIEFVHKYIVEQRNRNRAVLLVSFELDEIMSLSDRIEVIFDGRITGSVPGKDADEKELGFMMAGGKQHEEEKKCSGKQCILHPDCHSCRLSHRGRLSGDRRDQPGSGIRETVKQRVRKTQISGLDPDLCKPSDLYGLKRGVFLPDRRLQHRRGGAVRRGLSGGLRAGNYTEASAGAACAGVCRGGSGGRMHLVSGSGPPEGKKRNP